MGSGQTQFKYVVVSVADGRSRELSHPSYDPKNPRILEHLLDQGWRPVREMQLASEATIGWSQNVYMAVILILLERDA